MDQKLKNKIKETNDDNCTYYLCPDSKCNKFTEKIKMFECEYGCKKVDKVIVCWNCKEPIILSKHNSMFQRVDCECGASNFQRMSGRYRRININD